MIRSGQSARRMTDLAAGPVLSTSIRSRSNGFLDSAYSPLARVLYWAVGPTRSRFAWQYGTMLTVAANHRLLLVVKGLVLLRRPLSSGALAGRGGPAAIDPRRAWPGPETINLLRWTIRGWRPVRSRPASLFAAVVVAVLRVLRFLG